MQTKRFSSETKWMKQIYNCSVPWSVHLFSPMVNATFEHHCQCNWSVPWSVKFPTPSFGVLALIQFERETV
uniref:Uncharacterized protein n=1 Tax=Anguilla anguilla TaxID=7936 RepID=A0A0E9SHM4_ANGAN